LQTNASPRVAGRLGSFLKECLQGVFQIGFSFADEGILGFKVEQGGPPTKSCCWHSRKQLLNHSHLAIAAYNLCVLLQRRLGQLEKCELNTLRWRLFARAAIWSFY
jgi:hypothetical protein